MSKKFINQVIEEGHKVIKLLDSEDQKKVKLLVEAEIENAVNANKPAINDEMKESVGCAGFAGFAALLITSGIFYISRPDGWPYAICEKPHKEELDWDLKCELDGVLSFPYKGRCFSNMKTVYTTTIEEWSCKTDGENFESFTCTPILKLPNAF